MPDEAAIAALQTTVVWSTFAIAFVLGAIMARTNFCTMGAVADIANMSDWTRMRSWACAIGIAIVLTQLLAATGFVDLNQTLYTGARLTWLAYIVGGFLFGVGMVLASGCGSKTLVRIGGGSLKSLIVFVMIGLGAYMTIRGVFAPWRVNIIEPAGLIQLTPGQDLPRLIGGAEPGALLRMALAVVVGGGLLFFAFRAKDFRQFDPMLGGVGVGLAVAALWFVSGYIGYVVEHPDTLEQAWVASTTGRPESFTFVAPVGFTLELFMLWTDASRLVTIGIAAVFGVIAGSFAHALFSGQFRLEGFGGAEDTANHLVGGMLMGIGGVTALGCTVGQGLSGLSTLALGSMLATVSIIAGGFAALRYQMWRVERMV